MYIQHTVEQFFTSVLCDVTSSMYTHVLHVFGDCGFMFGLAVYMNVLSVNVQGVVYIV